MRSDIDRVLVIGVPMGLGQRKRGVDLGPHAIRYAGLAERIQSLGYAVEDCGDVSVPIVADSATDLTIPNARNLRAITEVCTATYHRLMDCVGTHDFALILGGDHSIAAGSVSGIADRARRFGKQIGAIWIDAHADYNTPGTSPSGNVHGMPIAALLGEEPLPLAEIGGTRPKLVSSQIAMIGIRDLDRDERARLAASGMKVKTMTDIDEYGIGHCIRDILTHMAHLDELHISLDLDALESDLDALESDLVPGVGTPSRGGLTYREAHFLMEILAETGKVASLDIVEVNPILDDRNRTAQLAVELAASLLGQRIL